MILSGMIGKLYDISGWIWKLLIVNGVWMLFNFPIVYLSLNILFVQTVEDAYVMLTLIFLLLPFISYPATTALFGLIRQWIVKKEINKMLVAYWTLYKQNFRRSVAGGLFFVFLWGLWIINYSLVYVEFKSLLFYVYLVLTVILLTWNMHFFSDTVHFKNSFFASIKKCLFMAVGFIHYTISLTGVACIAVYGLFQMHPMLSIMFTVAIVAYLYFFGYEQIIQRALKNENKGEHVE